MNLNMIQPKIETEDLLLSITKNCETLIEQTHRKAEETLEFKMIKPRETFHSKPPIQIKCDWMLGLTDLELYNSIFNVTKKNNKFEFYTDTFDEFSFEELKDEVEEILNIPNITDYHSEDETIGPRIIKTYWHLRSEKSITDGYIILLMGYARCPVRDFESYHRIAVGLDEDDIRLILKQCNSNFVTYVLDPGNHTIENLQKDVISFGDHEKTLQIEPDDLNKKTKLILTRFGSTFGTLRFDEKSFFRTLLKFEPYWDYKPTNAFNSIAPGTYVNDKILNLNTINKLRLKCVVIDGSIQDGVRQPILSSFVLDKKPGYKVFCEPETVHYKKINKIILNTITFYLEDDDHKPVDFNGETLTFT